MRVRSHLTACAIALVSMPFATGALGTPAPKAQKGGGACSCGEEMCMMHHGKGREAMMEHMKSLNLTPEQKMKIEAIHKEAEPKREGLRNDVMKSRQDLKKLYSEKAGASEIKSAEDKLADAQKKMVDFGFEQRRKISEVLTPEQKEKWMEKYDNME